MGIHPQRDNQHRPSIGPADRGNHYLRVDGLRSGLDRWWSRALMVLSVVTLSVAAWACGADSVCPAGTSGASCIPFDDVGSQPELPAVATNDDVMTHSLPDGPSSDGDAIADGAASRATNDNNPNSDTTDTTGDDQDEADGPGAPEARGTPGTRAGPGRTTIATTIATKEIDGPQGHQVALGNARHGDQIGAPAAPSQIAERQHGSS